MAFLSGVYTLTTHILLVNCPFQALGRHPLGWTQWTDISIKWTDSFIALFYSVFYSLYNMAHSHSFIEAPFFYV